jgi:hypothetical protein
MTVSSWWENESLTERVEEPFRSDRDFWSSLAAGADAFLTLLAAAAVSAVLAMTGAGGCALLPFVVPAGFVVRSALVARGSRRHRQAAFTDRRAWRDAERTAVAKAFAPVLRRPRHPFS